MTDGKIQIYEGKVLADAGRVATADECCCGEPCSDCCDDEVTQDDAVITLAGACDPDCPEDLGDWCCDDWYEGTYDGNTGCQAVKDPLTLEAVGCKWVWSLDATGALLFVYYDLASGTWCAMLVCEDIDRWFGGADCPLNEESGDDAESVTGISCDPETHKLSGTFTITGQDECAGCTATVTIG